jgi:hypothetical protein
MYVENARVFSSQLGKTKVIFGSQGKNTMQWILCWCVEMECGNVPLDFSDVVSPYFDTQDSNHIFDFTKKSIIYVNLYLLIHRFLCKWLMNIWLSSSLLLYESKLPCQRNNNIELEITQLFNIKGTEIFELITFRYTHITDK